MKEAKVMSIFTKLFGKTEEVSTSESVAMKEITLDDVKEMMKDIENETLQEVIKIKITPNADCKITDSKFGGLPYLPKSKTIPTTQAGRKLKCIAQINCEDLPENNIYHFKKGILQFWIADDDLLGLDFDNQISDEEKRVIYYPEIEQHYTEDEMANMYPLNEDEESYYPISDGDPFALTFTLEKESISRTDYRFEKMFVEHWNKRFVDNQIEDMCDDIITDEIEEYLFDTYQGSDHKIGGYPYFTQTDPRTYGEYENYDILLLQIDSEWDYESDNNYEIMWGDSGIGNFFITKEKLESLDFDNLLYNWDCC